MINFFNKIINKIFDNKILVFTFSFLIGSILTVFSLIPTYNLDAYCALASGYGNYALIFLNAGRFVNFIVFYLVDLINMPPDVFL